MSSCGARAAFAVICRPRVAHLGSRGVYDRSPLLIRNAHRPSETNLPTKNDLIPYKFVHLVDPETKALRPLQPLSDVVRMIDKKTHYVELVAEKPSPVVKIVQKAEAYAKKREFKQKLRAAARRNVHKEVQLTWSAAPSDFAHKLKKVRADLEKGYRVDLVFAPKSGNQLPTPVQMNQRAEETVKLLSDVSQEWKPRAISRTAMVLYLQGQRPPEIETENSPVDSE